MVSRTTFIGQEIICIPNFPTVTINVQETERRSRELHSRVKAPAEAEKYRMQIIAEAAHKRTVLEATATADATAMKVTFVTLHW